MTKETPLRRIRKERGLTVEQLAVKAGTASATVYRAERGERRPTDETFAALADALGVDIVDLRETAPAPTDASQRSPVGAEANGD
jgi:transcriptional regulator with XRE-family HTH domain